MKRLILFACIFVIGAELSAQNFPRIDSLRVRYITEVGLVKQGVVQAYINGAWKDWIKTIPITAVEGLKDTLGRLPAGAIDSLVWAKKWYLINQLAGKAATSHTQEISTITALQDSITALLRRAEATTLLAGKATAYSQVDTSAFTTTATRKAIYIASCRQTWQFGVATRKNGLPVAGDQLAYWTKTDSLIVFRAVGTTSGQMFGYWRVK